MQHKCKATVIDKKVFPDLQERHLADPRSGACPFYEVGQESVFQEFAFEDVLHANRGVCFELDYPAAFAWSG